MAYCTQCGAFLASNARFCSSCGAAVYAEAQAAAYTAVPSAALSVYDGDGYAVVLVDRGRCTLTAATDLISDTCGYSSNEAFQLVSECPTMVAYDLTRDQAVYLAQSMTEYGMSAAIYDRSGERSITGVLDSVFDTAGIFLASVASALGLIGIANRVTGAIQRLTLPSRPKVYVPPKPVYTRRHTLPRANPILRVDAIRRRSQSASARHRIQNQPKPQMQPQPKPREPMNRPDGPHHAGPGRRPGDEHNHRK